MSSYLAVLFFVLIAIPTQLEAQNDPTAQFCNKSIDQEICREVVKSSPMKDKKSVCNHALGVSLATVSEIGKIFQASSNAPSYKMPIEACKKTYGDVTALIRKSQSALNENNYNKVNMWISSAMSAASTCENRFVQAKVASPVTDLNKKMNMYLGVVITISNLP